ncbi:MAG: MBL fold metallo-hydrolase [Holosporaceae bacterium]|jgi:L-ascorbate metabolism protein UlaG (beta-lactamase superfamily)|nr:MBL fold metallo-hydrolase [Holosporaceae bacterium]
MVAALISALAICAFIALYLQLPMFGRLPQGERLARIEKLPNYRDGKFHNIRETPLMIKNPVKTALKLLLERKTERMPPKPLPAIKTDLHNLDPKENVLVWFGHSSYFIQIDGRRILVDPLFSKVSSPLLFFPEAFAGTDIYRPEDMPEIDCLIISHDHWDHLDYKTVLQLRPKVKTVICPIGVGEHFEYWGFSREKIIEMYWNENISPMESFEVHCLPARHFSGRSIFRNKSLWASFLLISKGFKIYIGGDSGYDTHYVEIGNRFGPMDIAILDSGQHNENWRHVHMMTDEVIKASCNLRTKMLLPAHICKISLAYHSWDEPLMELSRMAKGEKFSIVTPIIGEKVKLRSPLQITSRWWENLK